MSRQAIAAAALAAGTYAASAFVGAPPSASPAASPALRGADAATAQAPADRAPLIGFVVGAAGAATACRARKAPLALRAAAAAVAPAAEAEEKKPLEAEEEEAPPPPFNPAEQLGVTAPLGFFDPAGFCKVGDEEGFRKLRSAELKHGRVAMMASVGAVVQASGATFPGFEKVPKGLGAVTVEQGIFGMVALVLVSGALELTIWKDDPEKGVDGIGDFGNPLQLGLGSPLGESEDMRNREINNGRAAMFAVVGIIAAELATGKNALEQLL